MFGFKNIRIDLLIILKLRNQSVIYTFCFYQTLMLNKVLPPSVFFSPLVGFSFFFFWCFDWRLCLYPLEDLCSVTTGWRI